METLFKLEDQYNNSLKDFNMNVDYTLAYLTTDGQRITAATGVTDRGSAMYDQSMLPQVPPNFRCSELTTNVQCEFYQVNQNVREIDSATPTDEKITALKKQMTAQRRLEIVQSKMASKIQVLRNRFISQD